MRYHLTTVLLTRVAGRAETRFIRSVAGSSSSTRAPLYSGMNDNGDDSGMIKVAAQDVMLVPARPLQMPAAALIRRLRNVDVIQA